MHDRRYAMFGHRSAEPRVVGDVALDQRAPAHSLAMTARQIVIGHGRIAGAGQRLASVGTDIPRTARYEN